ncbi:cation diffusion facilitator family transporter [Fictibacillus sp. Mic-4]|uniref:cation diffusion facilitator family transporter n=1 Tax=Fictibacillus TaxID=1329200 RepID=UPI000405C65D|nr:cation diffusion facilitator family transporter [Fictibacillus gelatini]
MELRESIGKKVAWISVWSNVVLMVGKLLFGFRSGSDAVFADGIHSAADVFASVIVLFVIGIANKPPDKEHPYGHGKAEVIISGIVGILLLLVSLYIIVEAVLGFFHPVKAPDLMAMWVALFSFFAKQLLYLYSLKVSQKYNSKAIEAIAYDHKADIVASIAAAVGVSISIIGQSENVNVLLYADKVASIFVAYLIFKIAKEMLSESFNILLERNVNQELIRQYESIVFKFPEVKRIDRIRAREHGHYILVDLRISIDHEKTIKEGHDLGRAIKKRLMEKYDNIQEVLIHLNPYYED